MDLSTKYLGLELSSPIMPGASPMVDDLSMVRRLADAGAPAIVMHSLFEEQLIGEQLSAYSATESAKDGYAEAASYLPEPEDYHLGPQEYLRQVERIKRAVGVPVIASLNGCSPGGWLEYARLIAQAGADALELNVYDLSTDATEDAVTVEARLIEMIKRVRQGVEIPFAVKLAQFYTSPANMARRIDVAGADGLVLFNRLYQPDIDVENLEMIRINPVGRGDLQSRLRWIGLLYGRTNMSLACSGGVSGAMDVIKALMAGADVVQTVSALLLNGPEYLAVMRNKMAEWLEENEYHSLNELRGSMSAERCPDPAVYQRANYMKTLLSWRM